MAILSRTVLILSCLLLAACAEQPAEQKPAAATITPAATTPDATTPDAMLKPVPSNVRVSQEAGHSADSTYYVQNRVIASGGVISGALMGS
jgi:predicted component of type VI protein secretion system